MDEIKAFKYQITLKFWLKNHKEKGDVEFAPVYFYSTTKTMINYKYNLDKSFKKFFTGLTLGLIKNLAG